MTVKPEYAAGNSTSPSSPASTQIKASTDSDPSKNHFLYVCRKH